MRDLVLLLLLVVSLLAGLIQTTTVQTWAVKKAASWLGNELHTTVHVGEINLTFIKNVEIKQLRVHDLHGKPMIEVDRVLVNIGLFDLMNRQLALQKSVLEGAKVQLRQYPQEQDINLQFVIDYFNPPKKNRKVNPNPWNVTLGDFELVNSFFSYDVVQKPHAPDSLFDANHLAFKNLNANVNAFKVVKDSVYFDLSNLRFEDRSGFKVTNLTARTFLCEQHISLNSMRLQAPQSDIKGDLHLYYPNWNAFSDFFHAVKFEGSFKRSTLWLEDVLSFAPELKGIQQAIRFSGKVKGPIDDLRGRDMHLATSSDLRFSGDADFTGLPNWDETVMNIKIKDMVVSSRGLKNFKSYPFTQNNYITLPQEFDYLGNMHFKGRFTGSQDDFVAYGVLSTALGQAATDVALTKNFKTNKYTYEGTVKVNNFELGKLLNATNQVGAISANLNINGEGFTEDDLNANLVGTIDELTLYNYAYKHIEVNGQAAKKLFSGYLKVSEDNIDLEFEGDLNNAGKKPSFDFTAHLSKLNPYALGFTDNPAISDVQGQIRMDAEGSNLDELVGTIQLEDIAVTRNNKMYRIYSLRLLAQELTFGKSLSLRSDLVDGLVVGEYTFTDLWPSIKNYLGSYLPGYFKPDSKKKIENQEFSYQFRIKDSKSFFELLYPSIQADETITITGLYQASNKTINLSASANDITAFGMRMKNWSISSSGTPQLFSVSSRASRVWLTDSVGLDNVTLSTNSRNDSVMVDLFWKNQSASRYEGNIEGLLRFNDTGAAQFKFYPSSIIVADSAWVVDPKSSFNFDADRLHIPNLLVSNQKQEIQVNGFASASSSDSLRVYFKQFNLANLNSLLKGKGFALTGTIDAANTVTELFKRPRVITQAQFQRLFVNKEPVGNGTISSHWDDSEQAIRLSGSFTKGIIPNLLFNGSIYPNRENNQLDLTVNLKAFSMALIEPYVKEYCSDLKGQLNGSLSVKGTFEKPIIEGAIEATAKKFRVNYLNTIYSFSDSIYIKPSYFELRSFKLRDPNSNEATLKGRISHNHFKDFRLAISASLNQFLLLNTNENLNNLYYGKAYATGFVDVSGKIDQVVIESKLKTDKANTGIKWDYTKLFIPLNSTEEVSDIDYIKFVSTKDTQNISTADAYTVNLSGIKMDFDLEVTPDAEVQLIFDQKIGDIIKGSGKGNIRMQISTLGQFNMYGDYNITDGDYLFTLQNVINKRFGIESGGSIRWSGNPYDADIDLAAVYNLRTSIQPLFPSDSTRDLKRRYPVDCMMLLSGKLMAPDIKFDITLPTVDETTRQQARLLLSNEQEMNRQVFSLMVLNSFVVPASLTTAGAGETPGGVGAKTSSELLSNQLSNMLSKISNDFDVGVNYRPGDQLSKDEVELALSTQLFNDRIIIDGSVSNNTRNNATNANANNLVGDVNIEYKITDDGKFRVKAFNKANDNTFTNVNGPYTQGLGLFYREEFNTVGELYKRYLSRLRRESNRNRK